MCPGNRVAQLEVFAFVAEFVRDWKISLVAGKGDGEDAAVIESVNDIPYHQGLTIQPDPFPEMSFESRRSM